MVKVFIKGGVWKNSEDEILKAAVMKYGKQNWARVASLLNRKSAKQCKARWHEWLDPAVKKVEWSREEDEKLLHLAKLMPAQWKTIAPLVGNRTATQCQEQYERLLEEAAGGTTTTATSFQPGQIDQAPETKPARPDPIDMDDDEMEMLQEARARLANTQGKKAKRKAREKMLAQAKRLAELQKRRELKQAGLLSGAARKRSRTKRKEIDYGVEIAFYKPAPAGFHDTSSEVEESAKQRAKRLKAVDFQQVNENQYRTRDRDAMQAKKREEARIKRLEASNMQYVVAQVSQQNDATAPASLLKNRGSLELPTPNVSDGELVQLGKLQKKQLTDGATPEDEDGTVGVTSALLGDYSDRVLPTPMRTPASSAGGGESKYSSMLREASEMRRTQQGQTPLLHAGLGGDDDGGDDDEEEEDAIGAMGARDQGSAATPARSVATTRTTGTAATTSSRNAWNLTPHRDALGLNNTDAAATAGVGGGDTMSVAGHSTAASTFGGSHFSIRDLARQERRAAKQARKALEEALAALPAPQYEYELAVPAAVTDDDEDHHNNNNNKDLASKVQDQSDIDALQLAERKKEATKRYEERSTVVKRSDVLPRPNLFLITEDEWMNQEEDPINRLVLQEQWLLMKHDAVAFPFAVDNITSVTEESGKSKKKKKPKKNSKSTSSAKEDVDDPTNSALSKTKKRKSRTDGPPPVLESFSATSLEKARALVAAELDRMGIGQDGELHGEVLGTDQSEQQQQPSTPEPMAREFELLRSATMALKKKNDKAQAKLSIKDGGYVKRIASMNEKLLDNINTHGNQLIEQMVYERLYQQELIGARHRSDGLKKQIEALEEQEATTQRAYGDLLLEKKKLMVTLRKQNRDGT